MAEDTIAAAGAKIFLSAGVPATLDAAGYGALSYTEIGEIINMGEISGDSFNTASYTALGNRREQVRKGSISAGSQDIEIARSVSDAGQALLKTAAASDSQYSFKVSLIDGTVFYYRALVMSATTPIGTVDDIVQINSTISIQSAVVEVLPP